MKKIIVLVLTLMFANSLNAQKEKSIDYTRKRLYIRDQKDERLKYLEKYTELEELNISDSITDFPDVFSKLQKLNTLIISNNGLISLPNSILEGKSIKELEIWSEENILQLPDEIDRLESLTALTIENTGIKELPNTIGNLAKLISIDLSGNNIQRLPNEFCRLKNLESVYINKGYYNDTMNTLTELPPCFGELSSLKFLSLDNQDIIELPKSFSDLRPKSFSDWISTSFSVLRSKSVLSISIIASKVSDGSFKS